MKSSLFLISIFCLVACKRQERSIPFTYIQNGLTVKGTFTYDSLLNDTVFYYNTKKQLVAADRYLNGLKSGPSVQYSNERKQIITEYKNGLKHGQNIYFDSAERKIYSNYFYNDIVVGPIILFDSLEKPKTYFFSNLQNETLLEIHYNAWQGISSLVRDCINFTVNVRKEDTTRQVSVLFYQLAPPRFDFNYTLYKKNVNSENDYREIKSLASEEVFSVLNLPILPNDEQYIIGLNVYDSILSKRTVIYKDVY